MTSPCRQTVAQGAGAVTPQSGGGWGEGANHWLGLRTTGPELPVLRFATSRARTARGRAIARKGS